jgi:EAL domain-containing protein (putative c-di-GMP-specific phosphodiesterase class I)
MEALKDIFDLETSIRNAIKNKEFELYYQPKINFKTSKISGVEALVRWNHPGKGIIHPKEFIPFLEESTLIIEVGKWIFEEACKQSNIWKLDGVNLKIAVNISQLQLKQDDFIDFIKATLENFDVSSDDIEIELTESLSVNIEDDIKKLQQVKDMGISISIDDFGTGYSSLSYLENLPISKIKIDLFFVQNLNNLRNRKITETIINLANKLNLKTISEGIETKEQLDLLKSLKCDEGQGYYFSRPVSSDKIKELYIRYT